MVNVDDLDPKGRCLDVRPVHTGSLPSLKATIKRMGYINHNPIVLIKDETQNYVIVDGRHRVICVQELVKEGRLHSHEIAAVLLDENIPEHLQHRLATGKKFILISLSNSHIPSTFSLELFYFRLEHGFGSCGDRHALRPRPRHEADHLRVDT